MTKGEVVFTSMLIFFMAFGIGLSVFSPVGV